MIDNIKALLPIAFIGSILIASASLFGIIPYHVGFGEGQNETINEFLHKNSTFELRKQKFQAEEKAEEIRKQLVAGN